MKSGIKCPECNSCLDVIWIMPNRFYHCWLCKDFYNNIDKKITKINIEETLGVPKESLESLLESYYENY
jgi:hypothetical protein